MKHPRNLPVLTPWGKAALAAALLLAAGGCPPAPPAEVAETTIEEGAIRLVVVDDPALAEVIEREWNARAGRPMEVRLVNAADRPDWAGLQADLLIYPSGLLGTFAEQRIIAPLAAAATAQPEYAAGDVFRLLRLHETTWGHRPYAVTFGSPQLVLAYRADLFRQLEISQPQTWEQYQNVVQKLGRLGELGGGGDEQVTKAAYPTVEPLGPGWASQMLLARAASYARHRSQYSSTFDLATMRPLIDGPPFVRALRELAAASHVELELARTLAPADAWRMLLEGRTAMAITWPSAANGGVRAAGNAPLPVAFAPLPGSREMFSIIDGRWETRSADEDLRVVVLGTAGRLGSVARTAARPRAALAALLLLSGPEWSGQISPASPDATLFRHSHVRSAASWVDASISEEAARQYAELAAKLLDGAAWIDAIRIPGRHEYLAALDEAVWQTLAGEAAPEAALAAAAARWAEITARLGIEAQREAYLRSLGLEP